jgi:hypothetical protein
MSVAARRPRLCEQPAAGAFPLAIGSLRFDLTVVRKPPPCRTDERPLMWAPVGRVTAAPAWRGAISGRLPPPITAPDHLTYDPEADTRHWEALRELHRAHLHRS